MTSGKYQTFCEGWINLKSSESTQQYCGWYARIRNRELHLYSNDSKICQAQQTYSLHFARSVTRQQKRGGRNGEPPTISIAFEPGCHVGELRIKVRTLDELENWFQCLYVVCLLQEPPNIHNLLPGQKQHFVDILKWLNEVNLSSRRIPHNPEDGYWDLQSPEAPTGLLPRDGVPRSRMTAPGPPMMATNQPRPVGILPVPNDVQHRRQIPPPIMRKDFTSRQAVPNPESKPSFVFPSNSFPTRENGVTNQNSFSSSVAKSHTTNKPPAVLPRPPAKFLKSKSYEDSLSQPTSSKHGWYIGSELTREDAETILEENKEFGNLILRKRIPSDTNDQWTYAVSVKMDGNETPEYKHYKIKKVPSMSKIKYCIHLNNDTHPTLHSLEEVVKYFAHKSPSTFRPMTEIKYLRQVNDYEEHIHVNTDADSAMYINDKVIKSNSFGRDCHNLEKELKKKIELNETSTNSRGQGPLSRQVSQPVFPLPFPKPKGHPGFR